MDVASAYDSLQALRLMWTSGADELASEGRRFSRGSSMQSILRAARFQFAGQVDRSVAALEAAKRKASIEDRLVIDEILGPLYVTLERFDDLETLLDDSFDKTQHRSSRLALKAVLLSRSGDYVAAKILRKKLRRLDAADDLLTALTYQRASMSAFYSSDFAESLEFALLALRIASSLHAHRLVAVTSSVLYAIHHTQFNDPAAALAASKEQESAARACGDLSIENMALVAQYEIAAECADDESYENVRRRLRSRRLPQQFREHFQQAFADALSLAWKGDFYAFKANIVVLQGLSTLSRSERALCYALRGLAEAANHETDDARKHARCALSLSARVEDMDSNALELRVYRQSRSVAAAVCMLIGDTARGRRVLEAKYMQGFDANHEPGASDYGPSNDRSRGISRAVEQARNVIKQTTTASPLTPAELVVLRLLDDGMSAPDIARETKRSVHTVRVHTRNLILKLGVRGRNKAIARARQLGYL